MKTRVQELIVHECDQVKFLLQEKQDSIEAECEYIKNLLLEKNRKYGNSALEPVRIFSKADPGSGIAVRLDDKLSRIANQQTDDDEDAVLDMIGYLILFRVSQQLSN